MALRAVSRILSLLAFLVAGCGQALDGSCPTISDGTYSDSAVSDGTYSDSAGDAYTFVDGQPPGWSCIETAACPLSISCAPVGETVYTVEFVALGNGAIQATTSPPGAVVVLTLKGAP